MKENAASLTRWVSISRSVLGTLLLLLATACAGDSPSIAGVAAHVAEQSMASVPTRGAEFAARHVTRERKGTSLATAEAALEAPGILSADDFSDAELFALGAETDTVFSVGIKQPGTARGIYRGRRQINAAQQRAFIAVMGNHSSTRVLETAGRLPMVRVHLSDVSGLARIRKLPFVDYVEPRQVRGATRFMSGCENNFEPNDKPTAYGTAYGTIATSFIWSKLDQAWSITNGSGVKIGLTDSGVYPGNTEFVNFTSGASAVPGRAYTETSLLSGSVQCNHGTRMAAVQAAPNNGVGVTGAAWGAALHSVRSVNSAWTVTGWDAWAGIADASDAGAKVISMAWGGAFWSWSVADEIDFGFYERDIVFIGAAGTSGTFLPQNWVAFPAMMPEVLAVSSTRPNGTRDAESHYGPELDVTAYGDVPTTDQSGAGLSGLGRSSGATAVVTGVAALVRSRFPFLNAPDVYARIKSYAGSTCGIHTTFGPVVNALPAVGSFCDELPIAGPGSVWFESSTDAPQTLPLHAPSLMGNPAGFQWSDGSTVQSRSFTVEPGAPGSVELRYAPWVTVTDLLSGHARSFVHSFEVHTGPFGPGNCGGNWC
jgi:Subtilase family